MLVDVLEPYLDGDVRDGAREYAKTVKYLDYVWMLNKESSTAELPRQ